MQSLEPFAIFQFNIMCNFSRLKQALDNTEGAINNGQSSGIDDVGYIRRGTTKQNHNTICVGHHYTQTSINNLNKA